MLNTTAIDAILETSQPDEAIRDYLRAMLRSSKTTKDAAAANDLADLKETLSQYIPDNPAAVEAILTEVIAAAAVTKKTKGGRKVKVAQKKKSIMTDPTTQEQKEVVVSTTTSTTSRRRPTAGETTGGGVEDEASSWNDCRAAETVWGGRGRGGRGAYAGRVNSIHSNVHLEKFSVTLANGTELLESAVLDITKGHRYGLIGRNGCGKSTLLRRLADKTIPGLPHDMKVLLVEQKQQIIMDDNTTTLECLMEYDADRTWLLHEQERLEALMMDDAGTTATTTTTTTDDMNRAVDLLADIAEDLDLIDASTIESRALAILQGLQFTNDMIHGPVGRLSGGWRMRLAIAQALLVRSDLICLDEVTNHLDLHGLEWLVRYINTSDKTIIVVSHDPVFLDAICTDIYVLAHRRLDHHVGSYSQYQRQLREKTARETQILDAAERQQQKAQAFVQKQQAMANKKSADPNKQRQAKMIREKKIERIGNYREDGKRYKLRSLQKLDEKYLLVAQKVHIEVDEKITSLLLPNPTWPPSVALHDNIWSAEDLEFAYNDDGKNEKVVLSGITTHIDRGSKIALVGANGCGKSTLMNLIDGQFQHDHDGSRSTGTVWVHPSIRIGHITQYSVEELDQFADETVLEYAEKRFLSGVASATIIAKASGNVRHYLGAFGLGGKHALQRIGQLSGGERMRLCFATCLAEEPHLLLLDESTNHVDLETLEAMSTALNKYEGSVLMVSHNQAFLRGFCKELWVLEDGRLSVKHSETATFDELFAKYRHDILGGEGAGANTLSDRRQQKAIMAKKATAQRVGAKEATSLL